MNRAINKNMENKLIKVVYYVLILLLSGIPAVILPITIIPCIITEIDVNKNAKKIVSIVSALISYALIYKYAIGILVYTALLGYSYVMIMVIQNNKDYNEILKVWALSLYIFTIMEISSYNPGKVLDLLFTQDGKKLLLLASIIIIKSLIDLGNVLVGLKISALIVGNLCNIISIINYFTMSFINKPFRLDEVALAGTALNVVDNYRLGIHQILILILLILLICIYNYILIKLLKTEKLKLECKIKKAITAGIGLCIIYCLWFGPSNIGTLDYMSLDNYGTIMGVLNSCKSDINEPEYYNDYKDKDFENVEISNVADKPNIIIIMNEAFSDLSVVRDIKGINVKKDILHYTSDIMNNTYSGYLYSSVWGNNTVSSEFECITGIPTSFVTTGAKVYNKYMNESIPSLAKILSNYGYSTYGVHPYDGNGYNRLNSWDTLGFENKLFIDNFSSDSSKLRQYISDEANYSKLYEITENEENPAFIFNITMQNHGGYDNLNQNDIYVENDRELSNYLYLIRESDKALNKLIEYYSYCDEDTIIVFFGDHQPSLTKFYSNTDNTDKYKVPYFIWSNYELKHEDIPEEISINYIPSIILNIVGINDKWYNGIYSIINEYPVVANSVYKDSEGNKFVKTEWKDYIKTITDDNKSKAIELMKIYSSLSYKYIVDSQ